MKTLPLENLSTKGLKLCPEVENLKFWVSDDDLTHLIGLTRVTKIELVFHVGVITGAWDPEFHLPEGRPAVQYRPDLQHQDHGDAGHHPISTSTTACPKPRCPS